MRKQAGFTLIELMIVVAIIALLAGIAVPSYRDYVMRGQLTTGTAALSDGRIRLEQYYQDQRTYADNGGVVSPCPADSQYFTYACVTGAATYMITATGRDNLTGFKFTINQANVKATTAAPTGWNTSATCWMSKRGDSC